MFSCSSDDFQETLDQSVLKETLPAKRIELEILDLINTYRVNQKLKPLNSLDIIKSVAFTHTDYMVSVNKVNHDNFYQRKSSLVKNISAVKVTENVAYAYGSAESVVNAWLNSPAHRANLEGDFTDFEISAEMNSEGKWYFTNIFVKR